MDKQDELAVALVPLVDSIEFRTAVADPRGEFGKPEDLIAAAVRSFMGSDANVARAVAAMRDDPFADDAHLLGTTQQDRRMEHYARTALGGDGE